MYVSTVTFSADAEHEGKLQEKIRSSLTSLKEWETCLAHEAWVRKDKHQVHYTLVSKWDSKKDFQGWLKRPEHLEHHRQMALKQKENPEPKIAIEKSTAEFEIFE